MRALFRLDENYFGQRRVIGRLDASFGKENINKTLEETRNAMLEEGNGVATNFFKLDHFQNLIEVVLNGLKQFSGHRRYV